ncbi:MAG: hypothetical protein AB1726_14120 [Planctomycetota bacterium]
MRIATSPRFRRSVGVRGYPFSGIYLWSYEQDPADLSWYSTTVSYSTSYAVRAVDARISHELYVAGQLSSGIWILERWRITPATGEYYSSRPAATGGVGAPFTTPSTDFLIKGGTYRPPSQRQTMLSLRSELWSGLGLSTITSMAADPDGRFLLILDDQAGKVFRVKVQQSALLEALYTAAELPDLVYAIGFGVYQHTVLGRVYEVNIGNPRRTTTFTILLVDNDNDGDFDAELVYDEATYAADHVHSGYLANYQTSF